jgi:hypothetical protein
MLRIDPEVTKGIDVEIELDDKQRALLASAVKQEWFDIVQKIMVDQVKKFNLKLINTDPSNREEVLAAHHLAKAVAQFYVGFMKKISDICEVVEYSDSRVREPINENTMEEFI